jgi:uncharacterized membrane protein YcaP (DUF421 family)
VESVIRPLIVYLVLFAFFRLAGKRTLASTTMFDFVLLLILAESVQEALIGEDGSMTNAMLVVMSLILFDIGLSLLNQRSDSLRQVMDDVPLILINDGIMLEHHLEKSRVSMEEILAAARETQGLEKIEQIKYAVLEVSGGISIVPQPESA